MTVAGLMSGTSADGIDVAIVRIKPRRPASACGQELSLDVSRTCEFPFRSPFAPSGARCHERPFDRDSGAGAIELEARASLQRSVGRDAQANSLPPGFNWLPWTNHLSPAQGSSLCRAHGGLYLADWRDGALGCAKPGARSFELPARRYGRRRSGRSLGLPARLHSLSSQEPRPGSAESGRHRQSHGDSAERQSRTQVLAFDTGPGNMVIDQLMQRLFKKNFDAQGKCAARGSVIEPVFASMLRHRFFLAHPAQDRGARAIRPRVHARFSRRLPESGRQGRGHDRDGHGAYRRKRAAGLRPVCESAHAPRPGRLHRLRRRREKSHPHADVARRARAAGLLRSR